MPDLRDIVMFVWNLPIDIPGTIRWYLTLPSPLAVILQPELLGSLGEHNFF